MKKLLSNKLLRLISITAVLVLAVSATGCGSEQSSDSTSSSNVYSVEPRKIDSEPETQVFHVGDTIAVDFEICCTKFEDEDYSDMFIDYGEGVKIVRAYLTAKNTGKQKDTISSVRFIGVADGEDVVEAMTNKDIKEEMKTRSKNDMFLWDAEVKPGETYGGYVYYVVPEDFTHFEIRYVDHDAIIECK